MKPNYCARVSVAKQMRDMSTRPHSLGLTRFLVFTSLAMKGDTMCEMRSIHLGCHTQALPPPRLPCALPVPVKPKNSAAPDAKRGVKRYCLCRSPDDGRFMIGCDSCDGWYHPACAGLSEQQVRPGPLYERTHAQAGEISGRC
jgi:hypothetical protein